MEDDFVGPTAEERAASIAFLEEMEAMVTDSDDEQDGIASTLSIGSSAADLRLDGETMEQLLGDLKSLHAALPSE